MSSAQAFPPPGSLAPMMACPGELPSVADEDKYAYEMKWDGVRALAYVTAGSVTLWGRRGRESSTTYPELSELAELAGRSSLVLDGEIVALDAAGRPDFARLQQRMHVADASWARRLASSVPVTFLAFDVLHLDGHSLVAAPYTRRRELLEQCGLDGSSVGVPPVVELPGAAALEVSRSSQLEGLLAKRRDAPYEPGVRSPRWIKVKNTRTAEVLIIGWKPGSGRRAEGIGSLLLGMPDGRGELRYVGHVGSGFTGAQLNELAARLAALAVDGPPTDEEIPREHARGVRWVRPQLVGEVRFGNWTPTHRLRHPVWRGLRLDKGLGDLHQDEPPPWEPPPS